jgi:hypothetical protein
MHNALLRITDGLARVFDRYKGHHAIGEDRPSYVPVAELEQFWTDQKIKEVFSVYQDSHRDGPYMAPATIRAGFIRVFSLLVWIGRLETIETCFTTCGLSDSSFPLLKFPSDHRWQKTDARRELYNKVFEQQWKFFPFIFERSQLHNRELPPQHILPIVSVRPIKKGEATVDLIHVERSCFIDLGSHDTRKVSRKCPSISHSVWTIESELN